MIHTKDHKTLNNSGSGASKTSPSVPLSKPPESTSSGPLRSATAKTATFQTRIRLFGLFYTLYTPAEGRSTSSEAGSPLFWGKSRFCPLTLSNRSVSQETGHFELLRNYHSCRIPLPRFIQGGTLRHIPCKLLLAFAALLFPTALSCLKNPLGVYAAAVHFIFQLDHRRPIQVPN